MRTYRLFAMKLFLLTLTIILAFNLSTLAKTPHIEGRAQVIDGDTIAVEGTNERIRLYGIDAPEGKQSCDDEKGDRYLCGSKSAEALAEMIGRNGRVICYEEDRDRYGRIVGSCYKGDLYLNEEMVRTGWALEYTQYSDGRFTHSQNDAQLSHNGLWSGSFTNPWEWRRGKRLHSSKQTATKNGCVIKGNISSNGNIYHLSGQEHYDRTQINTSNGEQWFCTEDEAVKAGWRKAKR